MVTARICDEGGVLSYLGAVGGFIARSRYRMGEIYEIRLRAGRHVALETVRGRFTLDKSVSSEEIGECMKSFCHYSIHSYEKELREGYITLKGGHRVGFCGTAVIKNGVLEGIKEIGSINVRIAREAAGCGEELRNIVLGEGFKGLLIAGKPMSGKTTLLRDLCRIIGDRSKLALVDSRSEIAAAYCGIPQNNVGQFTDVLNGYDREEGIEIAVRTLSPEYIACDEITGVGEIERLCADSGVKLIFTLHCGSVEGAMESASVKRGAVSHIAFLGGNGDNGKFGRITKVVTL